jgi:hypothetical protein
MIAVVKELDAIAGGGRTALAARVRYLRAGTRRSDGAPIDQPGFAAPARRPNAGMRGQAIGGSSARD